MTAHVNTSDVAVTCRIMAPGSVKYSQSFEGGTTDSWVSGAGMAASGNGELTKPSNGLSWAHSGARVLVLSTSSAGTRTTTRTLTGLTIGRRYTFIAWVLSGSIVAGTSVGIGISGIGSVSATPVVEWQPLTYTFSATATSHTAQLIMVVVGSVGFWWDDLQLFEHEFQTDSVDLEVDRASVKVDERRAPYVEATIVAPLPDVADLVKIDPRTVNIRVTVAVTNDIIAPSPVTQSRTYDLVLHQRQIDFKAAELTLTLTSDESKLIDAGNITTTVDHTAETNMRSLRAIVVAALARYYAPLEADTADFDLTVTFNATNRINNPSFEVGTTGCVASTGTSAVASVAYVVAGPFSLTGGTKCLRGTASASTSLVQFTPAAGIWYARAGETYTLSFWLQSSVSRSANALLQFRDAAGTVVGSASGASAASILTSQGWTRYVVTAVAPAGTNQIEPFVRTTGNAVGNLHYVDGVMLTDGADVVPSFDGSWPADTYYTYAWAGTAHASESTRTRLDNRDRHLLEQQPGDHDWDFIARLVQASGLRLFCDESRVWRLVNPATYTVAGTVAVEDGDNLTGGTDTISKQDGSWADAVVVKYTWIGTDGLPKTAYDAASTGAGTTLLALEWARAYPGPGAAAAVLARAQKRGRVQQPRALIDLNATPGMELTTVMESTPAQEGVVAAVEWDWSSTGGNSDEMTVTARDLVDA